MRPSTWDTNTSKNSDFGSNTSSRGRDPFDGSPEVVFYLLATLGGGISIPEKSEISFKKRNQYNFSRTTC